MFSILSSKREAGKDNISKEKDFIFKLHLSMVFSSDVYVYSNKSYLCKRVDKTNGVSSYL